MKTKDPSRKPTSDELRAARIAGFTAGMSHYFSEKRERLLKEYLRLDARREANIKKFSASLGGTIEE